MCFHHQFPSLFMLSSLFKPLFSPFIVLCITCHYCVIATCKFISIFKAYLRTYYKISVFYDSCYVHASKILKVCPLYMQLSYQLLHVASSSLKGMSIIFYHSQSVHTNLVSTLAFTTAKYGLAQVHPNNLKAHVCQYNLASVCIK